MPMKIKLKLKLKPTRQAVPLIAVRSPKAELRRSGPRIRIKIGDIAATQHPVRRPNKPAQTMNAQKVEQIASRNNGGNTRVIARAEKLSGCSQDLSQSQPEITLPIVLLIPVVEMM